MLARYARPVAFYSFGLVGLLWALVWFRTERAPSAEEPPPRDSSLPVPSGEPVPWRRLLARVPVVGIVGVAVTGWFLDVTGSYSAAFLLERLRYLPKSLSYGRVDVYNVFMSLKVGRMTESVRWTLTISKDTDVTLRTFLARSGLKKGDLSKFVEDAVQWRLMKLNIAEARARNAHLRLEEIESAVDQAVNEVRAARLSKPA